MVIFFCQKNISTLVIVVVVIHRLYFSLFSRDTIKIIYQIYYFELIQKKKIND